MKILVIGKPTDALRMLPPETLLNFYESASEIFERQGKEGTILEAYTTPIGYSVAILNYDSADKWVEEQKDLPMLNYMEWEIYPLADYAPFMNRTVESLKKMVGK